MCPQPFQYLTLKDLPDVFDAFIMSWMVFGLLTVLVIFGASCLLKGLKIDQASIFKHLHFRSAALSLVLLALLFGMAAGYFEAWTYRLDFQKQTAGWYDVPGIFGGPGDLMANSYGGDWQDDEAWDYRSDIAIWNGLFWTSVAAVGVLVMRFVFRNLFAIAPPTTQRGEGETRPAC